MLKNVQHLIKNSSFLIISVILNMDVYSLHLNICERIQNAGNSIFILNYLCGLLVYYVIKT